MREIRYRRAATREEIEQRLALHVATVGAMLGEVEPELVRQFLHEDARQFTEDVFRVNTYQPGEAGREARNSHKEPVSTRFAREAMP